MNLATIPQNVKQSSHTSNNFCVSEMLRPSTHGEIIKDSEKVPNLWGRHQGKQQCPFLNRSPGSSEWLAPGSKPGDSSGGPEFSFTTHHHMEIFLMGAIFVTWNRYRIQWQTKVCHVYNNCVLIKTHSIMPLISAFVNKTKSKHLTNDTDRGILSRRFTRQQHKT